MITTLHIKNIGIIEDLTIDFNKGFNVLTGDTGSGKTLIIKSIDMLSGGRFSKDMIKKGMEYSSVEACIYLKDGEKRYSSNYIIVSRQVFSNGKNLCKIDGNLVSVLELKNFMKNMIDIHGQYDNQELMDIKSHINFLDRFCKENIRTELKEYKEMYIKYKKIEEELNKNYGDDIERQRKLDLLNYQLNEIVDANLKVDEEVELENKKQIMKNYEKINDALNVSTFKLENNILVELENIIRPLEKIENVDINYSSKITEIKNIYYVLQDYLNDFNSYKDNLSFDEEDFKYTQDRLDLIFNLKRKYGNSISAILDYKEDLEKQINEIENLEEHNNNLKIKQAKLREDMLVLTRKIDVIRRKYAIILQDSINSELKDLEMQNASFRVNVIYKEDLSFNENGLNKVEFEISTNIGEDFKPLIKIASGGEISRIMLAIKSVLSDVDTIPTIIFDEIDTGISGSAVKAVAKKIKRISKSHQILAITHQALLSASADYNYKVEKSVKDEKTVTSIKLLDEDQTVEEIAKISTGQITDTALKHAFELRKVSMAS